MKKIFASLFLLLILPSVSALNLNIEKQSSDEVMIAGLDQPAVFNLQITNLGEGTNIEFYNLLGFNMFPKGTVSIARGETKSVDLKISPISEFNYRGAYTFDYFIRGSDDTEIKKELTFKIIDLKNAFEVGSGEINPESNSMQVYIHNKINFDFGEVSTKFSSPFFDFQKTFSLGPYERKNFEVELNKEDFKKLMAGYYTINAEIQTSGKTATTEGVIKFIEKDILETTSKDSGIIINTKIIEKTNKGNVVVKSENVIKKNIISRLFTSFSPEPDMIDRDGFNVYYTWSRDINPGESLKITVKTNWFLPSLVIFFIVAIVVLVKQYTKTDLILKKRVSFVRAKGGEFALKVTIFVNAKKYIERINITDRLPPLVKLHETFGRETPSRVNEQNRRIEWQYERLNAGESRVISYIIYSKIGVVGRFALPSTSAIYERDGEIREAESNRTFFVAEQRSKKDDED